MWNYIQEGGGEKKCTNSHKKRSQGRPGPRPAIPIDLVARIAQTSSIASGGGVLALFTNMLQAMHSVSKNVLLKNVSPEISKNMQAQAQERPNFFRQIHYKCVKRPV